MATEETAEETSEETTTEEQGSQETESTETDWKAEARKHEKRWKQDRQAREALEAKLAKIEDANKSETEKAIEAARKEAAEETRNEFEKERRSDRLQVAVSKHARELADVDDVLLNIERAISDGEIDESDIFDDQGRVIAKALERALEDLLKQKPHLKAGPQGRPSGDVGAGQGTGGGGDDMNALIRGQVRR